MLILFTILLAAQAATPATITPAQITPVQIEVTPARRVAILPWTMIGGVEEAQDIAKKAVLKMFESTNYTVISATDAKRVWEEDMHMPRLAADSERESEAPPMPTPEQLLALGQALKVDLVCSGNARWHTKSVWISLGPKTKADCTVNVLLIDVGSKQVVLDARDVKADDTKVESGLETAGALLVSGWITVASGGPKTPHQKKAGVVAVAKAFDPWIKEVSNRKIAG